MYDALFQKKGLSLERLHTLVRLGDSSSLSRAANHDPVRQSQFSRQLRELESYYECLLTQRTGKTLTLSPAGQRLARMTRHYFASMEQYIAELRGEAFRVRIGAGERIQQWLLAPHVHELESTCPVSILCFHNTRSSDVLPLLQSGELDAGIIRADGPLPPHIQHHALGQLRYACFVPKRLWLPTSKLGKRAATTLPLADLPKGNRRWNDPVKTIAGHSLSFDLRYECATLPAVARLIASGQAAGLLPVIAARDFDQAKVACYTLPSRNPLHETLWLTWNKRTTELFPHLSEVLDCISRMARREVQPPRRSANRRQPAQSRKRA
jgi:DNA-binding transcriptional LysR family regulator